MRTRSLMTLYMLELCELAVAETALLQGHMGWRAWSRGRGELAMPSACRSYRRRRRRRRRRQRWGFLERIRSW